MEIYYKAFWATEIILTLFGTCVTGQCVIASILAVHRAQDVLPAAS